MATLPGRKNASTKGWTAINWIAVKSAVPRIPYWISRDALAPAIAPNTTPIIPPARAKPQMDRTMVVRPIT
jgi:hypothetical protein